MCLVEGSVKAMYRNKSRIDFWNLFLYSGVALLEAVSALAPVKHACRVVWNCYASLSAFLAVRDACTDDLHACVHSWK